MQRSATSLEASQHVNPREVEACGACRRHVPASFGSMILHLFPSMLLAPLQRRRCKQHGMRSVVTGPRHVSASLTAMMLLTPWKSCDQTLPHPRITCQGVLHAVHVGGQGSIRSWTRPGDSPCAILTILDKSIPLGKTSNWIRLQLVCSCWTVRSCEDGLRRV